MVGVRATTTKFCQFRISPSIICLPLFFFCALIRHYQASPHVTYRYLLEKLASRGYLIVATPHDLSFDHLQTCDLIISRFERIAPNLARTYGALPVVGIGHSLGALLHLLITSLFPDTPRAANALISFNNKPVGEAVPFFEEVSSQSLWWFEVIQLA